MDELAQKLAELNQSQLLRFWNELTEPAKRKLRTQIESIDFASIQTALDSKQESTEWEQLAEELQPPEAILLNDSRNDDRARATGEEALRAGKVGMILVAGGQGTRLGFEQPKGLFPVGPVSNRCLFQVIIDRLIATTERYRKPIPLFIMTSPATHEQTMSCLAEYDHFGLDPSQVFVFCQGTMPAFDAKTGKILLESREDVALSPDGHGGMLAAFAASGALAKAKADGLEYLFYAQIDNPLVQVADPELIGHHIRAGSELTTQVVRKRSALERVGNVVSLHGKTRIIEYSDLPESIANRKDQQGELLLWAGNIAVHVFSLSFLIDCEEQSDALPLHRAHKKVPYIDKDGTAVSPERPNAIKLERFIFDLLPQAKKAIVVEVATQQAFAPVKNASGAATDTPETARDAMVQLHRSWLEACGVSIAEGVAVEINDRFALDRNDLQARVSPGTTIDKPTYFFLG